MSFFKRYPRFWIAVWAVFGFGSLVMIFNGVFDHGFDIGPFAKGAIGLALAGMMIGYLLPSARKPNA